MNGRQRILRTIAGQPVDRPALAPFLHVNFIKEQRIHARRKPARAAGGRRAEVIFMPVATSLYYIDP